MKRIRRSNSGPGVDFALLVLWGLFIVYGTTIPFDFSAPSDRVVAKLNQALGHPWQSASRMDVVSNVLLFLPWGFLFSVWLVGRRTAYVPTLLGGSLSGLALSGFVEFLQLFAPTRTTSVIDLATNLTGSLAGAAMGWPLARWASPWCMPEVRRIVSGRPMLACSLLVAAGLMISGLSPFDVSIDVGDLKSAVKSARPIPFGPSLDGSEAPAEPWSWTREALTWMMSGGLFMLAFREARRTGPWAICGCTALAGGLCLTIELLQIMIRSRSTDATSVVWSLLGSLGGAALVARVHLAAARRWLGPALVVWFLIGMIEAWTPPHFAWPDSRVLSPERLVPFLAYYRRTDIFALADLISQTMYFVPLGAMLAARSSRMSLWACVGIGFTLGLVLEAGQLFLVDRTCEITDALSAAVGAGLGLWLWRWGESMRDPSQGIARYRVGTGNQSA